MPSKIQTVFPTYLYRGQLSAAALNRDLSIEIARLAGVDPHGRKWSRAHYRGGYSSYSSMDRLHRTSPNFGELERRLRPHVRAFARKLNWDLSGGRLEMTTCWANAMGEGTHHTMHTHPKCALSGVYYVSVPPGSSPLKIEDPRLPLMMSAPSRRAGAPAEEQNYLVIPARAGHFVLFESWMRHEVPPHRGKRPRLSISFNYEL